MINFTTTKLLAIILLIVLLPLILIISLVILTVDGRPIFYKQKRVGCNNTFFNIFKFRTMKNNVEDMPTHLLNNPNKYLTRTGDFLRKSSFDEIPQILNIVNGKMTFIGIRPSLYNQEDLIKLRKDLGLDKFTPGVTGWAQVNGRDLLSINEKVVLEKYYYDNKSITLDMKILFLTLKQVIFSKGISH